MTRLSAAADVLTATLPLIAPALVSGRVLAPLRSTISCSRASPPDRRDHAADRIIRDRLGVKPEINAICTIVIAVVATGIVAASLLMKFHDVGDATRASVH